MKTMSGVCALVLACGVSIAAAAMRGGGESVTVVNVYRRAEYRKADAKAWKPVRVGTRLGEREALKTSNNSYADMRLDERNRFRLRENSLIEIRDLFKEESEKGGAVVRLVDLDLLHGEILSRLERLPAGTRLNLSSPVAIAAVRGTTFLMGFEGGRGAASVAVSAGSVTVTAAGEPQKFVRVAADQRTVVSPWARALFRARGTGLPPKELLIKRLGDPRVPIKDAREKLEKLEKPRPSLENVVVAAEASATAPGAIAGAEEARRRAIDAALVEARKGIIRKLKTIRLSGEETIADLLNSRPAICDSLFAATAGAERVKVAYDEKTRTATVKLALPLEAARKIIGRDISFAWREIKQVSLDEYAAAFGAFIRAAVERAAVVDGYRRLAEEIYGTVVNSTTTLKDFAVKIDGVEIAVRGVVRGAREVSKTYYSDGSIDVDLEVTGDAVRSGLGPVTGDVFGKNYMASPVALSAENFFTLIQAREL